jgi:glycosyltransferase involved in cell wall biosynthesis
MKIVFFHRGVSCNGNSINEKPLGGTETALIFMAAHLRSRGHEVFVFTNVDKAGEYDGVFYRSWENFETFTDQYSIDIFICVRELLPLMAKKWGKVQIYFSPDAYDQPSLHQSFELFLEVESQKFQLGLFPLSYVARYTDAIFCVGYWQAETFAKNFKIDSSKLVVVHNGVSGKHLSPLPLPRRKPQLVYASTPFRGLEFLLKYFPEIRRQVPDAQCAVLSGMQTYGMTQKEDSENYNSIYELGKQPGVTLYGPLAQPQLHQIFCESRLMAYPNTFPETFCMAVLEAQAAGLPIVTTDSAGLKERVTHLQDGFLIDGHPSEKTYQAKFVRAVVQLLQDDPLWNSQSEKAVKKSSFFSYDHLAGLWEKHFERLLSEVNPPFNFDPKPEHFQLKVSHEMKTIDLSSRTIRECYGAALKQRGFPKAAVQILR